MKITEKTTITEAEVERMRLGITSMYVSITHGDGGRQRVEVLAVSPEGVVAAIADSWPTAIGDVYAKRTKQLAEHFTESKPAIDQLRAVVKSVRFDQSDMSHGAVGFVQRPRDCCDSLEGLPHAGVCKNSIEPYRCNVPMCGDSGVCANCRARGAR